MKISHFGGNLGAKVQLPATNLFIVPQCCWLHV